MARTTKWRTFWSAIGIFVLFFVLYNIAGFISFLDPMAAVERYQTFYQEHPDVAREAVPSLADEDLEHYTYVEWMQALSKYPELFTQEEAAIVAVRSNAFVQLILNLLLIALFYYLWNKEKARLKPDELEEVKPSLRLGGRIAISVVGLQMLMIIVAILAVIAIGSLGEERVDLEQLALDYPILSVVLASLIAPVLEELVFRGLIFTRLRSMMNLGGAIVLQALLFAIVHAIGFNAFNAFVAGLMLSILYLRTGSLWAPMLAHAINNFLPNLLALFSSTLINEALSDGMALIILLITLILFAWGIRSIYKLHKDLPPMPSWRTHMQPYLISAVVAEGSAADSQDVPFTVQAQDDSAESVSEEALAIIQPFQEDGMGNEDDEGKETAQPTDVEPERGS